MGAGSPPNLDKTIDLLRRQVDWIEAQEGRRPVDLVLAAVRLHIQVNRLRSLAGSDVDVAAIQPQEEQTMTNTSISQRLWDRFGDIRCGETIDVACGCSACDQGIVSGHFACDQADEMLVLAEKLGYVTRDYDNGAWRWFVAI